jgi:DNA repair protein RecO (recombination protein O)
MTTKSLQALVLHKQWSGDTSARVTFFTREMGLINCLCRGGRTPKKQSLLQAFTPLWLGIDERHEHFYARSIESTDPMLELRGDALFSGLYVNELLYYVLKPVYADASLFDAYWATLNDLAKALGKHDVEAVLRRFEWALISACGYSFSLTDDAATGAAITAEGVYRFEAGLGFIPHGSGILGAHILALAEDNLADLACLKSAKLIMRQAIDHLVGGREIKARALYI